MGFAGGFTLGTVQAGFHLVGKRELKGGFGVPNCEANRHLLGDDWHTEVGDPDNWSPMRAEYVFGNPPCSGFSLLSDKSFRGIDSPINSCMWNFQSYVARTKPLIAAFESVGQAFSKGLPLMRGLFEKLKADTGDDSWRLYHVLHNNLAVGGCAQRKRYFWVVSRIPFGVEQPMIPTTPILWDAIGDLADLDITWERQPYKAPPSWWAGPLTSDTGMVDGHNNRENPEIKRAMDLMAGLDNDWPMHTAISVHARRYYELHGRLPDSWERNAEKFIKGNFENMGFHQTIRWDKDRPARVVTGGTPYAVIHPTKMRLLSHREVARIMGFPDDWLIRPLMNQSNLRQTWGKGIPVGSGRWLSRWVYNSITGNPGSMTGTANGAESIIDVTRPRVAVLS